MKNNRRDFFRQAGMGAAALGGLSLLPSCNRQGSPSVGDFFSKDDVLLFQGDSITDAGRNRKTEYPNDAASFGFGYAGLIAAWLLAELAHLNLTIYNRGISGNKVYQLDERWDKDCLLLKPDVLSILIGVNDYWHMRNGKYDGTPEVYAADYKALLKRTRDTLPDVKLIICEPFILTGTTAVDESWVEPFREYQESAWAIAEEFEAVWVPFQTAFSMGSEIAHPTYWAHDGVHPSMAGAQLMAETWLRAVG